MPNDSLPVDLNLERNFLDGSIPKTLGDIPTLRYLRLNNNVLEGRIPASFSNLYSLEIMKVEANRLKDRIEDEICDLRDSQLRVFIVDCPVGIAGTNGLEETFGVVCPIPECCSRCISQ